MSTPIDLPIKVGEVVAGKYRIDRLLGAGGMGAVVAAEHLDLGELRAIKFMLPALATNAVALERFLREARAASRLRSQHVARVYDIGRLESGTPYIVMELLDGVDLKSLLQHKRQLSIDRAVSYLRQACEAIGEAHALGIVHRDIKPANLFLTTGPCGEDCIKVLDFGIVKFIETSAAEQVTRTFEAFGTPLYMSPEQMRSSRVTDERTDVWSLGVLLYRMLVGSEPFLGDTVTAVCSSVVADAPARPSTVRAEIPKALEDIVLCCLSKDPAGRFNNAIELRKALESLLPAGAAVGWPSHAPAQHHPEARRGTKDLDVSGETRTSVLPSRRTGNGSRAARTELIDNPLWAPPVSDASQTTKTSFMADSPATPPAGAAVPLRSRSRRMKILAICAVLFIGIGAAIFQVTRVNHQSVAPSSAETLPAPSSTSSLTAAPVYAQAPESSSTSAPASVSAAPSTAPVAPAKAARPAPSPAASLPGSSSASILTAPPTGILDPWAPKPPKTPPDTRHNPDSP